jgi:PAS domain S-box-containing protein
VTISADSLIQVSLLGEAVENGPAPVFVADETRRYVAVNRAACALLGYERDELLALRVDDVVPDVPGWAEMASNGAAVPGTVTLRRKDGKQVEFNYLAGKTVVAGMPVFVSVGR